jgi:hypothetical protein
VSSIVAENGLHLLYSSYQQGFEQFIPSFIEVWYRATFDCTGGVIEHEHASKASYVLEEELV